MINPLLNTASNGGSDRGLFALDSAPALVPAQIGAQIGGTPAFGQLLLDAQLPGAALPVALDDATRKPAASELQPVDAEEVIEATAQVELPSITLLPAFKMPEALGDEAKAHQAVIPTIATLAATLVGSEATPNPVANEAVRLGTIPSANVPAPIVSLTAAFARTELAPELAAILQPACVQSAATQFVLAADATRPAQDSSATAATRQPLAAALAERLQVQITQRSEHATVRLDPPSMGTIEIVIRQEAGHLHVQLRASNGEVARQLHAICETLRQDLVQRQQSDVTVQVAEESRDGDGRHRGRQQLPWRDEPGRALNEAGEERRAAFALGSGE